MFQASSRPDRALLVQPDIFGVETLILLASLAILQPHRQNLEEV